MRPFSTWKSRLSNLFRKKELDGAMDEEIRAHIDLHTQDLIAGGMNSDEARTAAFRQFGRMESIKETCRDNRGWNWLENLIHDFRFGARMLSKKPGFTIAAAFTLALGIGANTVVFAVANALLFKPLGLTNTDRLAWIQTTKAEESSGGGRVSWRDYLDLRESATSFESIALISAPGATWEQGERFEELPALSVTPSLAEVLSIRPAYGRLFSAADIESSAPPTVLISYELWQSRFSGASNILGQTLQLNDASRIIVGVLPAGLAFPLGTQPIAGSGSAMRMGLQAFWFPMSPNGEDRQSREARMGIAIGRLKPKLSASSANTELTVLGQRLAAEFPASNRGMNFQAVGVRERTLGPLHQGIRVLAAAVIAVLSICCVNLANLLLAAGVARQKDLAVRLALGAGRRRIVQSLLAENLLLAMLGGILGMALAAAALHAIRLACPAELSLLREATLDKTALAFTFLLSMGTVVVFGLVPALKHSSINASTSLRSGSRSSAGPKVRLWQNSLLVGQVAVVLMLMIAASLLIESFRRVSALDLGYQPQPVVMIDLQLGKIPTNDAGVRRYRELVARLAAVPGVVAAGTIQSVPLTGKWTFDERAQSFGKPLPKSEQPSLAATFVAFDYFQAMGVPLIEGRFLVESDLHLDGSQTAVMLNQTAATVLFSGSTAVGQKIALEHDPRNFMEVVGVVKDTRDVRVEAQPAPRFYLPYAFGGAQLVVRVSQPPAAIIPLLRQAIEETDSQALILEIKPMSDIVSATLAGRRFLLALLTIYAAIALAVGSIGVLGVVSSQVSQRTQEFGIRLALGATPKGLVGTVLTQVSRRVIFGLLLGVLISLVTNRWLGAQLFEVSPSDPQMIGVAGAALLLTALGASLLPACRAGRVSPVEALRAE